MSYPDKMICKALDRLHADLAGQRAPCRWRYQADRDVYLCEHLALTGKQVIEATGNW